MNNFEKKSINAYNQKANYYENTADGKFTERFKNILTSKVDLKNGDEVLDVACGNGKFLKMLSKKADISAFGVDISDNMIAVARENAPNMIFETSSCENIPFDDSTFDIITVCASYHHFPKVNLFAKEVHRLLKPNGRIYIAELFYPWLIRKISTPFLRLTKSGDYKIYSPEEIIKTFSLLGLSKEFVYLEEKIQVVCLIKN